MSPESARAIVVQRDAVATFPAEFEELREVAERQGVELVVEDE
jgi:DNA transposition AAA+ family ATPase